MPLSARHPLDSNPALVTLLNSLHALSLKQESETASRGAHFPKENDDFQDQLVALDEDKCRFIFLTLRTMGATRVVEAGTSYGISLLWLLAAVEANLSSNKSLYPPLVVGTELLPAKAAIALKHVAQTNSNNKIPQYLNVLVGDLLVTLVDENANQIMPVRSIDCLLLDIWAVLSLDVLKSMLPKLRKGGVVFVDNTVSSADRYHDLLEFIRAEQNGFTSENLPFSGGLLMAIYDPPNM